MFLRVAKYVLIKWAVIAVLQYAVGKALERAGR